MPTLFQINVVCNSGSTGRIAEDIGELVQENGWKSYIAFGRWSNSSSSVLYKIGKRIDLLTHVLYTRLFDKHGFASKRSTRELIKVIEQVNPDIIHLHNIHGYYLNIEILFDYLSVSGIPVVWTLHDCWAMTGHCVHFQDIGCERWMKGCKNYPNKHGYPASLLKDRSKKNYLQKKALFTSVRNLTVVSVCHWLNGIVGQSFLRSAKRKVIVNGIDLTVFTPRFQREEIRVKMKLDSFFVILVVATGWNRTKGLDDIYKLRDLLSQHEVIVVVGLTKQQIKRLPSGIVGIERTENVHQLADLYSMTDVFINPTYQDTLPTVNIESLACGTPVVTYNTGGSANIVSQDTGFVVERGDLNSMLTSIFQIKQKGKVHYEAACRQRAVMYFDKKNRYVDYLKLYEQLISKNNII